MLHHYEQIRELLHRVRSRWKARSIFLAAVRASLAASAVLGVVLILAHGGRWAGSSPIALAAVGFAAFGLVVAAIVWGVAPLRHTPSDARLARFIEERTPSLDDRLVSAVDLVQSERYGSSPAIAEPMLADAARRAGAVDLDQIVPIVAACWRPGGRGRRDPRRPRFGCPRAGAADARRRVAGPVPFTRHARGDAGQRAHQGRDTPRD